MSGYTENKLSGMERKALGDAVKAMSPEELMIVTENIPSGFIWDEMKRRDEIKGKILRDMESVLKGVK